MTTKHTPGPWTCTPGRDYDSQFDIWDAGGNGVHCSDSERHANAHLIAAAPDLLAALEPLAAWAENERRKHHAHGEGNEAEYMGRLSDNARAAIAKAKGE